jgi:hypothetical protein
MYLSKNSLEVAYLFVHCKDKESCGHFIKNETNEGKEELYPYLESFGEDVTRDNQTIGSCTHSGKYPMVWHTHPINKNPYPSPEDIVNTLKQYKQPRLFEIIFTELGIWTLSCPIKFIAEDHPQWTTFFISNIQKIGDDLHTKIYINKINIDTAIQQYITNITNIINTKVSGFQLKISFSYWPKDTHNITI